MTDLQTELRMATQYYTTYKPAKKLLNDSADALDRLAARVNALEGVLGKINRMLDSDYSKGHLSRGSRAGIRRNLRTALANKNITPKIKGG